MSRAAVGALERGRHMPAADAAIRVARALGVTVEELFAPAAPASAVESVLGDALLDGALVRASEVGGTPVVRVVEPAAALAGAPADAVLVDGQPRYFAGAAARGAVIAGCDPLLAVAEVLLERPDATRIVGVPTTSGRATEALAAGRCHAVLVHGPAGALRPPAGTRRWHVASWRSGLASHPGLRGPSLEALLAGDVAVVARDPTAASQQAVDRAAQRLGIRAARSGRTAGGHLEAARLALESRAAAVTIEPVALGLGLRFHELEVHDVELWVPDRWLAQPGVRAFLDLLGTPRFLDRARALSGYDLSSTGVPR